MIKRNIYYNLFDLFFLKSENKIVCVPSVFPRFKEKSLT